MVRRGSGVRVPASALREGCKSATSLGQRAAPAGHEEGVGPAIRANVAAGRASSRARGARAALTIVRP
jgi:hypothetical protein